MCIRAVEREAVRVQVKPVAKLRFIDIFVQHRPDGEGAACLPDAVAHALDHRLGNLDLAGYWGGPSFRILRSSGSGIVRLWHGRGAIIDQWGTGSYRGT